MSVVEVVKYEKPNKQFEQNFNMKFENFLPEWNERATESVIANQLHTLNIDRRCYLSISVEANHMVTNQLNYWA